MPTMRQAGSPSQAQRRSANVFVLLRQLSPHFLWVTRAAFEGARTADREIAQADRWWASASQSPAWSGPGPTHVADIFTAARENCKTLAGAARLARRKVASVTAPTTSTAAVKQALVEAGGSVTGAARTLGIASGTLRGLVRAQPLLADVVFEQIEREIDVAHQVLWDGLDSDSLMTRIRAAAYILRHTEAGRRRGWGMRRKRGREAAEPQDVTIKWID
jgi:hypothetical protein